MKRIFIFLILIFATSVTKAQIEQPRKTPVRLSGGITYDDGKQPEAVFRKLVFWTNCQFPSYIRIYVNNSFKGKVTRSYTSAPRSGSLGCVTVNVTGVSSIKVKAVDANGNEWSIPSMKIGLGYTHVPLPDRPSQQLIEQHNIIVIIGGTFPLIQIPLVIITFKPFIIFVLR